MSSYTLKELRALVEELGFNANCKVTLLVGQTAEGKYTIIRTNDNGEIVVAS
jgi:hypothetical protein